MSDADLAAYYYQEVNRLSELASLFFVLFVAAGLCSLLFVALYAAERRKRVRLEGELAAVAGPERQLAVIHELGEAGRREVRRLAQELRAALLAEQGGGR